MSRKITKTIAILLSFLFLLQQTGFAQVAGQIDIAGHLARFHQSITTDKFRPLHLRYLEYLPQDNSFKLLIDKGTISVGDGSQEINKDSQRTVPQDKLESTSKTLFKYFLIGLTLPNESFWVNLRPDSPDNIIDDSLAKTDIGRIMLEADLELKKDTASATSPDTKEGRIYWDKLYKKAGELFGSENITIPTLTRPWIVPDEVIVRESQDSAYIYKATLKVMLEEDYLKSSSQYVVGSSQGYEFKDPRLKELNKYSTQLIKELIIPKLTLSINTSKKYAELRQVYYSLILAQWFKAQYRGQRPSLQGAVPIASLIDTHNLTNLTTTKPYSKETYFNQYKDSFARGEYNFQEPVYTMQGKVVRSYFSGGLTFGNIDQAQREFAGVGSSPAVDPAIIVGSSVQVDSQNKIASILDKESPLVVLQPDSVKVDSPAATQAPVNLSNAHVSSPLGTKQATAAMTLEIDPLRDIMQDKITQKTLLARHMQPISSIADKKIEQEIREEIVRMALVAPDRDVYLITDKVYKEIANKFLARGISLEEDSKTKEEIKEAYQRAVHYLRDILPAEEKELQKIQDSSKLLALDHPLVITLQGYLDRMADPTVVPTRLLVAVNGIRPQAISIGQTAVINLSLINKLDTVDEVMAVLAHEQGHCEFGSRIDYSEMLVLQYDVCAAISGGRLQEYGGDYVVPGKLAKIGLNTYAQGDALRKLLSNEQSRSDLIHGDVSIRILGGLVQHKVEDFESRASPGEQDISIPDAWRKKKIIPSLNERLRAKGYSHDFEEAVAQASPEMISQTIMFYVFPNENADRKKMFYLVNHYVRYINTQAEKEGLTQDQKNAAVLGILLNIIPEILWLTYHYDKDPKGQLAKMLRELAMSVLKGCNDPNFLRSVTDSRLIREAFPQSDMNTAMNFVANRLVYDDDFLTSITGRPCSFKDTAYLLAPWPSLLALSKNMDNKELGEAWLRLWLMKVTGQYASYFWERKDGLLRELATIILGEVWLKAADRKDAMVLINQLKPAYVYYETSGDLELDLQKSYQESFKAKYKETVYQRVCGNSGISYDELMQIFHLENQVARQFIQALQERNEEAFVKCLSQHPQEFLKYFEYDSNIKDLLTKDRALSMWVAGIIRENWDQGSFASQSHTIEPKDNMLEWDLQPETITSSDNDKLMNFIYGLEITKNLFTIVGREDGIEMFDFYLESPAAVAFLGLLPPAYLNIVIKELEKFFVRHGNDGDQVLKYSVYRIFRDRLVAKLTSLGSSDVKLAYDIYWYILECSSVLYKQRPYMADEQKPYIAGSSEYHNLWLEPVNKAYFQHLKGAAKFASSPLSTGQEAVNYYFSLEAILLAGERRENILDAYAHKLIDKLPDEELKDFMLRLAESGRLSKERYRYFTQKRITTQSKYNYFKDARDAYMKKMATAGSRKLSGAILIEYVLDKALDISEQIGLFNAMMASGESDQDLQERLIYPWLMGSRVYGEVVGYKFKYKNRELEIQGPGQSNFVPFGEFMRQLYDAPTFLKLTIMEKLLLSPQGLLRTDQGRKAFVQIVERQLPQEDKLSGLLADILKASVSAVDAERLFLSLVESLLPMFLQAPSTSTKPVSLELLVRKLKEKIPYDSFVYNYLGDSDIKLPKRAYMDFLKRYQKNPKSTVLLNRVEALAEPFISEVERNLGISSTYSRQSEMDLPRARHLESIDVMIQACQNLGPMGVRFLQVAGQYLPLSPEYQARFRDVYDAMEGQDKFTVFETLTKVAEHNPAVKKFIDEDLVSIDELLGGGSIVTVYAVTVRNRDTRGNVVDGVHKKVLKVRVPNAEGMVREVTDKAFKVIDELERLTHWYNWRQRRNYEIARRMINDIQQWLIQDIQDTSFLELDAKYQGAHVDYFTSNGMAVRVTTASEPNNKDVKLELPASGVTLNKLLKLKLSGKSLEQLVREENDPEVKKLLESVRAQEFSLEEVLKLATTALIEDFSRHLSQPIFTDSAGHDVYLLHSDVHFGNAILSPDLKTVYPIDRNFYLQFNRSDVDFVRKILTTENSKGIIAAIVDYFLSLPENQANQINQGSLSKIRRQALISMIGLKIVLGRYDSPVSVMMKILQELEANDINIPLKMRIMFKNIASINAMLKDSSAGSFSNYVRLAENTSFPPVAVSSPATSSSATPQQDSTRASSSLEREKYLDNPWMKYYFGPEAGYLERLGKFLNNNHRLNNEIFSAIDSLSDNEVVAKADQALAVRLANDGTCLDFINQHLAGRLPTVRELSLYPTVGTFDLAQIFNKLSQVTDDSIINAAGLENMVRAIIKDYYLIIKAMAILSKDKSIVPIERQDSEGIVADMKLYYSRVSREIGPIADKLLTITDLIIPADTPQKQEALKNLRDLITRLENEPELNWNQAISEETKAKIQVIDRILGEAQGKPIASSVISQEQGQSPTKTRELSPGTVPINPGGIDFRFIPIITQAMTNLSSGFKLTSDVKLKLNRVNLDEEWSQIDRLASSSISPSPERVKEYIQAACIQNRLGQEDINKIILCIANTLRCDEERCSKSEPALMDILIILESQKTPQQLNKAFLGIPS